MFPELVCRSRASRIVSASGLILVFFAGCGGSSSSKPIIVPVSSSTAPAPPKPVSSGTPAGETGSSDKPAVASKAAARRGKNQPAPAELPVNEDGTVDDLFEVLAEEPPGSPFALEKNSEASNVDAFAVTKGAPGVDSTRFVVDGAALGGSSKSAKDEVEISSALPPGFVAIKSAGVNSDNFPLRIRCTKDNSEMVLIPRGNFIQGKNKGPEDAGPQHSVFLESFYIDVREITYAQYERYRELAHEAKKRLPAPARTAKSPDEPVSGVNWGDAHLYTLWAGKELPTEAQWEKAARGPTGFNYPWGNGTYIWQRPRKPGQIDPVGSFQSDISPYGVYDMAGNVREWCADWYSDTYYKELAEKGDNSPRNPTGPSSSGGQKQRVVKGGSSHWYVWVRDGVVLLDRPEDVGFRGVLRLKQGAGESSESKSTGKTKTKAKGKK